jgi:hypothetical protein
MVIILVFAPFLFCAIFFFTKDQQAKDGTAVEDLRSVFRALLLLMISGTIPDIESARPIPALSCTCAPTGITFMEFTIGFRHEGAL